MFPAENKFCYGKELSVTRLVAQCPILYFWTAMTIYWRNHLTDPGQISQRVFKMHQRKMWLLLEAAGWAPRTSQKSLIQLKHCHGVYCTHLLIAYSTRCRLQCIQVAVYNYYELTSYLHAVNTCLNWLLVPKFIKGYIVWVALLKKLKSPAHTHLCEDEESREGALTLLWRRWMIGPCWQLIIWFFKTNWIKLPCL